MPTQFEQAVTYIKAGDIQKGKQLLAEVLKQNPRNENAWLWMSRCVVDAEQKRYCFDRVLKINPQNQHAIEGLRRLGNPVSPDPQPIVIQQQPVEKKQPGTAETVAKLQGGDTTVNSLKKLWKSGNIGKVIIGCLGLLVFCCLCSIPIAVFGPRTPTSAPTEIAANLLATQAEIVTETLLPTNVPPSTSTSEPTATAAPLSTPTTVQTAMGASCIPNNSPQTGKVVDVVDGDTIKVLMDQDGQTYTVRYIGMDTPENTSQVEYFGAEATAKNLELVGGKIVTLIKDVSETDNFGRLLRYIIVDNLFVNYELVAQGYANSATYPPDIACIPTFQEAEQKASAAELGLWNAPPTQAVLPTVAPSVDGGGTAACNCSGPDLDCTANFNTHAEAQACYNHCVSQEFGDVFRLDGNDNDGLACESLP